MSEIAKAYKNTDRELWREELDDAYSPVIYVTEHNNITICVGGRCITRTVWGWHNAVANQIDFPEKYPSGG